MLRSFADEFRMRVEIRRMRPVRFRFRGRNYYANPEGAAIYHVKHSTEKLAKMVDLIPGDARLILDVGGNCGLFSAFAEAACPSALIHCFEPSPNLLPIIRKNVRTSRVHVHQAAVGDEGGSATLFINRDSEQTSSLNEHAVRLVARPEKIERREVDCVSLDQFAETSGIGAVDVLKVDVQGYEGRVINGARNLISKVQMMFLESTWMEIDSIAGVVPFALKYGFTHAAVINPVYMGADILLARHAISTPLVDISFPISSDLLVKNWT